MSGHRIKLWIGLGAYIVAGATASQAMPGGVVHHPSAQTGKIVTPSAHAADPLILIAEQGGEGGEGGAASIFTSPEAAFLGQLQLMKGHLRVGRELLQQGAQ